MAWDTSSNAGFSLAEPWLPLHSDWPTRNVALQENEPASMLNLTKELLTLRRETLALSIGDYRPVACEGTLLAYERQTGSSRVLVALNLGDEPLPRLPEMQKGRCLLSTLPDLGDPSVLRGNEGLLIELST
jgi:glycosidase